MAKKLTTEEWIRKAKLIHGNRYDYSKVVYINSGSKVIIICPFHGEFEIVANSHLMGVGCKRCHFDRQKELRKDNNETFEKKSNKKHKCKYDYCDFVYISSQTKGKIICHEIDPITGKEHGEFWQTPNSQETAEGRC